MSNKARKLARVIIAVWLVFVVLTACTNDSTPQLPKPHKAYDKAEKVLTSFSHAFYCEYHQDDSNCANNGRNYLYSTLARSQYRLAMNIIHSPWLTRQLFTLTWIWDAGAFDY